MSKKKKPKSKKVNPRNQQASKAEVKEAKDIGRKEGLYYAAEMRFMCLLDKKGVDIEFLQTLWADFQKLQKSIEEHRVSYADLRRVLREEYGITIGEK